MDTGSRAPQELPPAPLAAEGDPRQRKLSLASTVSLGRGHERLRPGGVLPPVPLDEICWNARYRIVEVLGNGAQGVVYLARRRGIDGYETHVAVKFYFRDSATPFPEYLEEMRRVARQAQRINKIQNDHLIDVRDFVAVDETRVMVMEWIDGFDLRRLVDPFRFDALRSTLHRREWERLNDVVVSAGRDHCRLKPGVAVEIVRGCLAGLSDLHHRGVVHCDIKPSNIMIKRTGITKIIDIDSSSVPAEEAGEEPVRRGTPYYMAPEVLEGGRPRMASDVASLGYVLVELLSGEQIFADCDDVAGLLRAKRRLPGRLERLLPARVRQDPILYGLCHKMVAVDPQDRFLDADEADLDRLGAANFHRGLIKNDLSTEYDRELAWWIEACHDLPTDAP